MTMENLITCFLIDSVFAAMRKLVGRASPISFDIFWDFIYADSFFFQRRPRPDI